MAKTIAHKNECANKQTNMCAWECTNEPNVSNRTVFEVKNRYTTQDSVDRVCTWLEHGATLVFMSVCVNPAFITSNLRVSVMGGCVETESR